MRNKLIFFDTIFLMKYMIFDFNGTILDDVDLAINALNHTLKKYLDRKPMEITEYKEIFTFPVKKYYEKAGFDFEKLDWFEIGQYWMDYYLSNKDQSKVFDGVIDLLKLNHSRGIKNIIISASRQDLLEEQLKELSIFDYFDEVLGINDIYATSKIPIALKFISDKDPEECVYLGDTEHDVEVAKKMGVKCILIAKGHESKERLLTYGVDVIDDIGELLV